jgi:myo-inositol-1-phosphate synthase
MSDKIKIAVVGLGNCASSLIQGIHYYKDAPDDKPIPGLMHTRLGGYHIGDIEVVAAFDVNETKVGKDVSEAIYAEPNCTTIFHQIEKPLGVKVSMGVLKDGVGKYTKDLIHIADKEESDIVKVLKDSGAEIVVNYLPVGSENAAKYYAQCAIDAGCGFVNCIPVFIASNPEWAKKFEDAGLPIIGDDIKSQVGATIVHRTLTNLYLDRGMDILRTYQLNTGGNTDFMNMLERERLESKKISKTNAVTSQIRARGKEIEADNVHVGPSDFIPWQKDNKICFIRIESKHFGDVPTNLELRLSVEDSPNSAGVVVDSIRCLKLALNNGLKGAQIAPSAYFKKSPPQQIEDRTARAMVEEFIQKYSKSSSSVVSNSSSRTDVLKKLTQRLEEGKISSDEYFEILDSALDSME